MPIWSRPWLGLGLVWHGLARGGAHLAQALARFWLGLVWFSMRRLLFCLGPGQVEARFNICQLLFGPGPGQIEIRDASV